jgi:hypothetical protein
MTDMAVGVDWQARCRTMSQTANRNMQELQRVRGELKRAEQALRDMTLERDRWRREAERHD